MSAASSGASLNLASRIVRLVSCSASPPGREGFWECRLRALAGRHQTLCEAKTGSRIAECFVKLVRIVTLESRC